MKGEDAMSWKLDKRDRSFQFGRLLAAMERLEEDYYFSKEEKRQTNAIKSLNVFRLRPFHTYERVNRHLEMAYVPRVKEWQRARYERCRQEIMGIIRELPEEDLNKPLEDVYLMGYECQRMEFFKKHEQNTEEE
jgi:CRISPR-associated protein Csd1